MIEKLTPKIKKYHKVIMIIAKSRESLLCLKFNIPLKYQNSIYFYQKCVKKFKKLVKNTMT